MANKHDEDGVSRSAVETEVASLATSLGDLSKRLTQLAEDVRLCGDEELATSLFGVERSIVGALRQLQRSVRSMDKR